MKFLSLMGECGRFIADIRISLGRIFTHRWKHCQAQEAYRIFDQQASGKGVIEF